MRRLLHEELYRHDLLFYAHLGVLPDLQVLYLSGIRRLRYILQGIPLRKN